MNIMHTGFIKIKGEMRNRCTRCNAEVPSMMLGKSYYPKEHRPYLCETCYNDWGTFFLKHMIETYKGNWKLCCEAFLRICKVKVEFT